MRVHAPRSPGLPRPLAHPVPGTPQVDWRDARNWNCNNNVHPSRHGTYDGISMHPFETVFIKASWHVGEPFIDKYMEWAEAQVGAGTCLPGWGEGVVTGSSEKVRSVQG